MRINSFRRLLCLGLGLLLVLPATARAEVTSDAMPYVTVSDIHGKTIRLSRLIMGTDHLGKVPLSQTLEVLDEAARLGINAFDTAPIYANDIEAKLGQWVQRQQRNDLHVITKGGFPHDRGPGTYESRLRGSREQIVRNIREEVSASHRRLPRGIAIYLMHRDDADFNRYQRVKRAQTPVTTILDALSDPQLRSYYGMIGVSNWHTERVNQAKLAAASRPDRLQPLFNSPYFSLFEMGQTTIHSGGVQVTHADLMNPGFQPGVHLMTYSPLGGFSIVRPGWEAARARALSLQKTQDRYWGHVAEALFHPANARRYARAKAFTQGFNRTHRTTYTLDQMLNAYVMAHPRADFVVIGPRTVEQLRRTVQALALAKDLRRGDLDYLYDGAVPSPVTAKGALLPSGSANGVPTKKSGVEFAVH